MERFATPVPPPPQPTGRSTWNRQLKGMAVLVSAALPFSLGSGEEQKSSRQSKPEATESVNGGGGSSSSSSLSSFPSLPSLASLARRLLSGAEPAQAAPTTRDNRHVPCGRPHALEGKRRRGVKNSTCPVCLECLASSPKGDAKNREEVVLSCSHGFHRDCLATWLKTKDTCPMCRETLRSPKRREIAPRARPIAWTPPEYVPLTHVPRDDRVALQTHLRGDPLLIDPWMF